MNLLAATLSGEQATAGTLSVALTPDQRSRALDRSGRRRASARRGLAITTSGGLDVTVDLVEELGSECYLYCTADGIPDRQVVVRTEGLSPSRPGDRISLLPRPDAMHLFDAATGSRLPGA